MAIVDRIVAIQTEIDGMVDKTEQAGQNALYLKQIWGMLDDLRQEMIEQGKVFKNDRC